jgi:hypothetical protein
VKTIVGWILHVQVLKFAFIILNPEFANVCFSCLNPQNPGCQAVFFPISGRGFRGRRQAAGWM